MQSEQWGESSDSNLLCVGRLRGIGLHSLHHLLSLFNRLTNRELLVVAYMHAAGCENVLGQQPPRRGLVCAPASPALRAIRTGVRRT